ncbi:MAG: hypothetical protein OP8BY_0007 [Candidatus Saccharicenans subterraneus]|uniref:Uncharacterized protein n=1 Tax=Candidatus Saccharicenans subterraneus TaxID=2508984 RepID=A0A3E2BLV3_9BACT|nr:MAG: hypothetical protein OP8BY_0007 [Candidatus Saccharicenans subterraneum]
METEFQGREYGKRGYPDEKLIRRRQRTGQAILGDGADNRQYMNSHSYIQGGAGPFWRAIKDIECGKGGLRVIKPNLQEKRGKMIMRKRMGF